MTDLVRRLIAAQFPRWAERPVRHVPSAGTDNDMFRLGDTMAVRLPKTADSARSLVKEQRWLPRLAPHLPLPVPLPLGEGVPGEGFGLPWAVYGWLDGANAFDEPIAELAHGAVELGRFGVALRAVDATGGPRSFRGGKVTEWTGDHIDRALRDLGADGTVDGAAATEAWESVLRLPQWGGDPVWSTATCCPATC